MHGSYLILLRKAKAVIGLQSLYVIRQVGDSDGWVLPHSWDKKENKTRHREKGETFLFFVCDVHTDEHKHWLDHRVSEAASGTMRWLCDGKGECTSFNNAW